MPRDPTPGGPLRLVRDFARGRGGLPRGHVFPAQPVSRGVTWPVRFCGESRRRISTCMCATFAFALPKRDAPRRKSPHFVHMAGKVKNPPWHAMAGDLVERWAPPPAERPRTHIDLRRCMQGMRHRRLYCAVCLHICLSSVTSVAAPWRYGGWVRYASWVVRHGWRHRWRGDGAMWEVRGVRHEARVPRAGGRWTGPLHWLAAIGWPVQLSRCVVRTLLGRGFFSPARATVHSSASV